MSPPPPPSFIVAPARADVTRDENTVYFAAPEHSVRDNIEMGGDGGALSGAGVATDEHCFFRRHWTGKSPIFLTGDNGVEEEEEGEEEEKEEEEKKEEDEK